MQPNLSNSASQPPETACGGKLQNTAGWPSAIYNGIQVYFCSRACLRVFQESPDDFMAGKIEHPLEAE